MTSKAILNYPVTYTDEDLTYCEGRGVAFQTDMTASVEYSKDYYEKYIGYEGSAVANGINAHRVAITEKYCCTSILDMGIGSGEFIKKSRLKVLGYDINPYAVEWLKERDLFVDPYESIPETVQGVTLWDTMEHIPDPDRLLNRLPVGIYLIMSIPIFADIRDVKKSKHYRPNEHYYYFEEGGLSGYMLDLGFELVETSSGETDAGREDILSFVFRKFLDVSTQ